MNLHIGMLAIRLVIGLTFMAHGLQKIAGMFGGKGIVGTSEHFEALGVPLPVLMAIIVGCIETFGGLCLVIGIFTSVAGFLLSCVMAGAILLVHGQNGFWASQHGLEYNLILAVVALCIALMGPGDFTIIRFKRKV